MVRSLLVRGMLAGVLAGILSMGFATLVGEPQIDRSIAFEEATHSSSSSSTPEPVSRGVQRTVGLLTATVMYGVAVGGLFALAFAFCYGRAGPTDARVLAAVLAAMGFLCLVLVPQLKYPANPPAVGLPETIGFRTAVYFEMILIAVAALTIAAQLGHWLAPRIGGWNAAIVGGVAFAALAALAQWPLPTVNEVPDGFPAALLWQFRIAAWGAQAVLWSALGLIFGALAQRCLVPRRDGLSGRMPARSARNG